MKILLAPDSFKGTMTSIEVIKHLEETAKKHFFPLETVRVPIADGGEGTVDSLVIPTGGEYRKVEVAGPLKGMRIQAKYGVIGKKTAVIEMAQASGIILVPPDQRDPMTATTYGTGELIKAALDEGIREFLIGIGGSATNDGGIGAAQALGVRFTDERGEEVGPGGRELSRIRKIDLKQLDPRIKESRITVICDVSNPLTGPKGATAVYGPQKGVTADLFGPLEEGMKNYERHIKDTTGMDMSEAPGSGAAGGLGAALVAFMGAVLKPGIDTVLDYVDFEKLLEGVDLVVTGEGRIDGQSVFGKVPVGVARRSKQKNIPVAVIAGGMGHEAWKVYACGIDSIMPAVSRDMSLEEALSNSEALLRDAADRMFRFIKIGMAISGKNKRSEKVKNVKISITGDLGSGKSTVCRLIMEQHGLKAYSIGSIQRSLAQKYSMSILDFNKYMETHTEIDEEIDNTLAEIGRRDEDMILDSRMAWHFVPQSFKVYLAVDIGVAVERICTASRGAVESYTSPEEARTKILERKSSENYRYLSKYEVDCSDMNNYDLIIDTTNQTPQETADTIMAEYAYRS